MASKDEPGNSSARLREQAEDSESRSSRELQRTLQDLRIHQIELEIQNDELRRTQVELEATRARYFDLYDLAPIGYCTLDEQGLILEANLTMATLLGMDRDTLVQRTFYHFIFEADSDIFHRHRRRLLETGVPQACDLRMVKQDGSLFWMHLESTLARVQDDLPTLRVMLSDITEAKRLDKELKEKNAELEIARLVADQANLAKSKFLSSMSHELRSPLNGILGFAQLMDSSTPPPTPSQKESIDQILQAGWYLLDLINEILDLAVIESGKLSLSVEPVSLPEVMGECQAMVEQQGQPLALKIHFPTFDQAHFVLADRTRLKQILLNLLSNAIKFNRPGGTVTVECTRPSPQHTRISVADTGPGLSPEQLTHLFQPFNRLGQENSGVAGTGIGLVVAKLLIELMGGTIGVQSTVGAGTLFWFQLTSVSAPRLAAGRARPAAAARAAALADAPLRTLLYVEDNTANLALVEKMIARHRDLRLLSAQNGRRGIEIARESLPDVILMDINLPDISGIQALNALREDPLTAGIPVLALSANAMPEDIKAGLQAGFFRYLTKPIKVNEVMEAIGLALALPPA